ncbi:MAG: hypothetical protein J6Y74_05965 [Clostridia bacterium]|nr:hypothetical protein [Clostridia bacterium]
MKRSFRMIFIALIVAMSLVVLFACKGKGESVADLTSQPQAETEAPASSQEESAESNEEEAAGEEEEAPPAGETTQSQEGGADATATQENAGGDGTEENAQGENALTGGGDDENGDGESGEDALSDDGDATEDYLSYLYRTDRKQYYEYRAEQREIEILPLTFFDLSAKNEIGYPVSDSADQAGDYSLSARGENVASLHLAQDGKITFSQNGASAEGSLWGDYDRAYEVITECEGDVFGICSVAASKAKVIYFLVIDQDAYEIFFRKESSLVQIDAEPETIRSLMQEAPKEPVEDTNAEETKKDVPQEDDTSAPNSQTDLTHDPTEDEETARKKALAAISESGCYSFFEGFGGVAEISGDVTITAEREAYSLVFSEMSAQEFEAAEAFFDGMSVLMFSETYRMYQSAFGEKVFTFTLLLSESEGSISLRVEYAA